MDLIDIRYRIYMILSKTLQRIPTQEEMENALKDFLGQNFES
mgnify:CR=1 FL=1